MHLQSDNMSWFVGVVEDRLDPLQQGRVRVRVAGVHPFSRIQGDILGMPVEDLPWMSVCLPVTTASVSGISGAVTGLVNGSSVFGVWLDQYKTNGIVLGSYSGNQQVIPNSEEGFSDPYGQYPDNVGADTSSLNAGGAYGDNSSSNKIQNSNGVIGLYPGAANLTTPDDAPAYTIEKMLRIDEGVKNTLYWDKLGYPTIGIGHLILPVKTRDSSAILKKLSADLGHSVGATISQADISKLFVSDLAKVQAEIKKNSIIAPVYSKMNRSRQMALENMAFQLGTGGLAKFKTLLGLLAAGKYEEAANAGKNSLWAKQTPGRAAKICMVLKNGNLGAYGVVPPTNKPETKSIKTFSTPFLESSFNPFDPSDTEIYPDYTNMPLVDGIPEDLSLEPESDESLTLFVEPPSSYQGSYPYVKAQTTEGGHSQEFDDTPGHERYRLKHPTGSYVEVAPDGRKTDKCVSDYYNLVESDRHHYTGGQYKVNVGGKETYINFADKINQIEGNKSLKIGGDNTIEVAGNEIKKITGDGTIEVSGNIKIIVNGNANIEINGNAETKVGGNYTMNVGGTYNITSGAVTWNTPKFDVV